MDQPVYRVRDLLPVFGGRSGGGLAHREAREPATAADSTRRPSSAVASSPFRANVSAGRLRRMFLGASCRATPRTERIRGTRQRMNLAGDLFDRLQERPAQLGDMDRGRNLGRDGPHRRTVPGPGSDAACCGRAPCADDPIGMAQREEHHGAHRGIGPLQGGIAPGVRRWKSAPLRKHPGTEGDQTWIRLPAVGPSLGPGRPAPSPVAWSDRCGNHPPIEQAVSACSIISNVTLSSSRWPGWPAGVDFVQSSAEIGLFEQSRVTSPPPPSASTTTAHPGGDSWCQRPRPGSRKQAVSSERR